MSEGSSSHLKNVLPINKYIRGKTPCSYRRYCLCMLLCRKIQILQTAIVNISSTSTSLEMPPLPRLLKAENFRPNSKLSLSFAILFFSIPRLRNCQLHFGWNRVSTLTREYDSGAVKQKLRRNSCRMKFFRNSTFDTNKIIIWIFISFSLVFFSSYHADYLNIRTFAVIKASAWN